MAESTVTAKGQTTMPRQARDLVGAGPGTRLVWHVMPGGTVIVRAKTHAVLDLAGVLTPPKDASVPVDAMNPGVEAVAALDASVLVRLLVRDDAVQGAAAARLIRGGVERGRALFVPVTVLREMERVLRSAYGFAKADVLQALFRLLGSFEIGFESEGAVEAALARYQATAADFADCLHAALAGQAGEQPLWTFDRAAARLDGVRLLK